MFDAWSNWNRLMLSGWSAMETGARACETLKASGDVIAARSAIIGTALRSPLTGDYAELGRMVPEKVDAFSQAGSVILSAWVAGHSAWMRQMQDIGTMVMRGRPPTLAELAEHGSRSVTFALGSVDAGARLGRDSLAPLHRGATANARRLRRKKRSS